jgi:hypothetical protein
MQKEILETNNSKYIIIFISILILIILFFFFIPFNYTGQAFYIEQQPTKETKIVEVDTPYEIEECILTQPNYEKEERSEWQPVGDPVVVCEVTNLENQEFLFNYSMYSYHCTSDEIYTQQNGTKKVNPGAMKKIESNIIPGTLCYKCDIYPEQIKKCTTTASSRKLNQETEVIRYEDVRKQTTVTKKATLFNRIIGNT